MQKLIVIVCSSCGNEVEASPRMAKYALSGKAVCARVGCEGAFKLKDGDEGLA